MIALESKTKLMKVVLALNPSSRLASSLYRGEQNSRKEGDDAGACQDLDEREC